MPESRKPRNGKDLDDSPESCCTESSPLEPEIAEIAAAWPTLTDAERAAVMDIVRAAEIEP